MAIVQMQKVAVLAHHSLEEELIRYLHEQGVMEVSQISQDISVDHTEMNFRAAELQFAIQTLTEHATPAVVSALRKKASPEDVVKAAKHTDVRSIVDKLQELEEKDTVSERTVQEQKNLISILEPWAGMSALLDSAHETRKAIRIIGTIPEQQVPALHETLSQGKILADVEPTGVQDGLQHMTAVVLKTDVRRFEEGATRLGWTTVNLPIIEGTAAMQSEQARIRLRSLTEAKQLRIKERIALSAELPNLVKTETYLRWMNEKQGVREAISATKNTIALLGWIPAAQLQKLEAGLHRLSPAIAVLRVKPDEGEETPILLKHSKLIEPFVSVTTLYGLPRQSDIDPTAALSPFFILFFALCLTDAGYGLTLFVLFSIALLKMRKSVEEAPLIWLLWMSGFVSVLVGIPFGGWFGLSPDVMPEFLTKTGVDGTLLFKGQIWNLSQQSGITFLQNLALALGMTHLMFGMFLSGWHKWVHGQKAAAFWQDFTSHILIGSAILAIAAPLLPAVSPYAQWCNYALYVAVALAIWGKGYGSKWYLRPIFGLLGLMNLAIGLLSNGLSYLRILALGLVTGAMAQAVDQVAVEMGKLFPIWLGIPVVVIIFICGHLVSIALNTLGSFIHSGRLQFIEFFSQFFEGGGKPFSPFRRSSL